jgi:hypothetical protein
MRLMPHLSRARPPTRRPLVVRALPRIEQLESRVVPYSVSGDLWPNPQLITLSFVPDGTNLGGATSNLFTTFNTKFGSAATWQNQILKGAQLWAQQTNINFSVISDSGADEGSGNYQQGDPTIGDIRISGFNFGSSTLAMAYMPPPVNNYSIAGDIAFNTGQYFNINQTYDLLTVTAHEIGHSLGLYHSDVTAAEMYYYYNYAKSSLNSDDISGIRNIYSNNNARSYDSYNNSIGSFSAAANLTGLIDSNSTVLKTGLDITTTSEKEYFTITAPSTTTGTMTVKVQSSGLSMLAPNLTVYNSSQTQIGYVSGYGHYGTTLTLNITGVSAGQQFYVKVGGADSTAFGTGAYAMTFAFAGIAPQPVPLPNTQVLNGNPIHGGGGQAEQAGDPHGQDTAWDTFGQTANAPPPKAPTPNEQFVGQAYQDLLSRQVDSSGLQFWSGALDAGMMNRDQVVQGIQSSLEYRIVEVNNAYQQILGRQADAGGLSNFVHYLQNGGTVQQLKAILGSGQEFLNDARAQKTGLSANEKIVDFLFQRVLNRTADSSGLDTFSNALNNGTTPLMVASAIVSSQEADSDLVNGLYTQLLKRSADGAGLDSFTQSLRHGADVEAVVVEIVGSYEYFGLAQPKSSS